MGFLKGTTNQLILDAVLTDTGRQFLARNDGSFSIRKFALGDNEVDYSIITKFGKEVGNEKIIKNTPIAEAVTNQNYGLTHRLVSLSNPDIKYMPTLSLLGATSVSLSTTGTVTKLNSSKEITIQQVLQDQSSASASLDVELQDSSFSIILNNDFLSCNGTLQFVDGYNQASYSINATQASAGNGAMQMSVTLTAKSITTTMFDLYGNNGVISTYVRITGMRSGTSIDVPVTISIT